MASSVTRLSVPKLISFLFLACNLYSGCDVFAASSNKLLLHDASQRSEVQAGSVAFTHVPSSVSLRSTAGSIKLEDVPQILTLALGYSSLQDIEWKGLLAGKNIFNRPKANILFIIEGVDKESTLPFFAKTQSYPIVKNEAKSDLDVVRISPFRNFVSHISSILKEKPLVISFSAEKQLARAISAPGQNSHTVTWDPKEQSFRDNTPSLHEMVLAKSELLKTFENSDFGEDVKYQKKDHKFVVSVPGLENVSFDMNEREDFLFFAELEMIRYLHKKVKTLDDLLHDSYPDFFTFGISSLKGLSRRYGNNSKQIVAALRVLNRLIPEISTSFSQLYGGQALVGVVNLRRKPSDLHRRFSTEVNNIYEHVQDHLSSPSLENFNDNLPEVNLRENLEGHAMAKICQSVRSKLITMQSELEVSCDDASDVSHSRRRREVGANVQGEVCTVNTYNMAAVDDRYDNTFPAIFNISLWLLIIIGLALYAVCLVIWYMDPGRDSVIYRVTSQRMKIE